MTEGTQAKQPVGVFVEASGAYGMQLGVQPYVPTGTGKTFKHPLTNGYAVGVSAGWEFLSGLSLVGNWQYAASNSRDGEVANALTKVEGSISYHILALGLRWTRALGPGKIFGEGGPGVILPFETKIAYDYAAPMGQLPNPITGSGAKIDEYNLGFGVYGQLGYQWDLPYGLYLSSAVRVQAYQSNSDGKQTRLENFVTNFAAPTAVNTTIKYSADGPTAPQTYSAQDLRVNLSLGFRL